MNEKNDDEANGNLDNDSAIASLASSAAQDLRAVLKIINNRLAVLGREDMAERQRVYSAKEAAQRSLELAENLIAMTAERLGDAD